MTVLLSAKCWMQLPMQSLMLCSRQPKSPFQTQSKLKEHRWKPPAGGWKGAHATCPAGGHAAGCQPLVPPVEPEENAVPAAQDLTEAGSAGQLSCGTPEEGVGPAASAYEAAIDDSFIQFAQANRTGSSGSTCQHLIAYLHAAKSKVVILENVPEMAKEEHQSKHVRYLAEAARAAGYELSTRLLDAQEFMLPQRRKRAWTVLLQKEALGLSSAESQRVLHAIFQTVEKLKTRPIAASKLLLKTGDGALEAELCRRQADQNEDQCEYDLGLHQAFMSRKGVSWAQLRAPPSTEESAWFQLYPQTWQWHHAEI